jgi:hypothetical protein
MSCHAAAMPCHVMPHFYCFFSVVLLFLWFWYFLCFFYVFIGFATTPGQGWVGLNRNVLEPTGSERFLWIFVDLFSGSLILGIWLKSRSVTSFRFWAIWSPDLDPGLGLRHGPRAGPGRALGGVRAGCGPGSRAWAATPPPGCICRPSRWSDL